MAQASVSSVFHDFLPVLKNYAEDSSIFAKAMQIAALYQNRVDFPFSFDQLNAATEEILGVGIIDMSRAAALYSAGELPTTTENLDEAERLEVESIPKTVRERFQKELTAFCLSMSELMSELASGSLTQTPDGLQRVLVMGSAADGRQMVRFIRSDSAWMDLSLSPKEARFLQEALGMVAEQRDADGQL